jgi:hypothetical protein
MRRIEEILFTQSRRCKTLRQKDWILMILWKEAIELADGAFLFKDNLSGKEDRDAENKQKSPAHLQASFLMFL